MTGRERYAEYLRSPEWKSLARAARERAGHRCEFCGGRPDHVHHVRYPKDLSADETGNLIVLCESCHSKSHGIRGREMSDAMVLNFENKPLVAAIASGETLFRFSDAFNAIEYEEITKTYNAVNNQFLPNQVYSSAWGRLPDKFKREVRERMDDGTYRVVRYVTERGVYRMALNSTSAAAERFQDWVTEVCMSIRMHGCYPPPEVHPVSKYADDPSIAFLGGLLESLAQTRADIRKTCADVRRIDNSLEKIDNSLERVEQETRDFITARRFCADNRISSGYRDQNINQLGRRATQICATEGIKYLPKARQDGDFPANCYPRDVLARAAREIGLIH